MKEMIEYVEETEIKYANMIPSSEREYFTINGTLSILNIIKGEMACRLMKDDKISPDEANRIVSSSHLRGQEYIKKEKSFLDYLRGK